MRMRFKALMVAFVPAVDRSDLGKARQFAPEYSICLYDQLLKQEITLGDYTSKSHFAKVTSLRRRQMVTLIEDLHYKKGYSEETLFIAVGLADRYLINILVQEIDAPCLVDLAVTCLLVAAKLNQHLRPKFDLMNDLLESFYDISVEKQDFIRLEKDLLMKLNFDLQFSTPISFLERFERLFDLDCE